MHILEIGTFTGYSAICMAEGLQSGGELVSIERDPKAVAMAKDNVKNSNFASMVRILNFALIGRD